MSIGATRGCVAALEKQCQSDEEILEHGNDR
jgi:hypothetical protein